MPHGLERVQIDLMNNEHGSQRWRTTPDGPLRRGRRIDLGTVEDDVTGIQIIRYVAPILLVKAVDEEGNPIKDFTVKAVYAGDRPKSGIVFRSGGDISFESQQDGRMRSSQMLPDVNTEVVPQKDGYTTTPQTVNLKEAAKKELMFVLKKVSEKAAENPKKE